MWKIWTEWHDLEWPLDRPALVDFMAAKFVAVKSDGTRIREGAGRRKEDPDNFLYEADDVSFSFLADRFDRSDKDTRIYRVPFGLSMSQAIAVERARAIAYDIRAALLLLPASWVWYDNVRPIDVVFDVYWWNKRFPESSIDGNFP